MTSLKAICTSLKKSSFLLILLTLVLLTPLSGASFNIAIISQNESYKTVVSDVLDVFSSLPPSDFTKKQISNRIEKEGLRAYYSSLDKAYKNEDIDKINNLGVKNENIDSFQIKIVDSKFSDKEKEYLFSGEKEAYEYLSLRDGVDMIIAIAELSNDILPEICMYINGEVVHEAIFTNQLLDSEREELFTLFSTYFLSDGYRLIDIDFPLNGTLYVDSVPTVTYTGKLALLDGKHRLSYIVPGYKTKEIAIFVDSALTDVDLDLEKQESATLIYSAIPYDAKVYYNGHKLDGRMISDLDYPFTLTATREGFSTYSLQSLTPITNLTISLKPDWMDSVDLVKNAKSDFYCSLFATLISFGGYVASQTITNLAPSYNLMPVSVVLGGISLVSLVNMVDSMFEYFNSANYEM